MKGLDLSKFDRTSHGFLEKKEEKKVNKPKIVNNNKKIQPKKAEKDIKKKEVVLKNVGRPQTAEEPLDQKIMLNLALSEFESLKESAGQVPLARYVRNLLKDNKLL